MFSSFESSNPDEVQAYAELVYDGSFTIAATADSFRLTHRRADHSLWTWDTHRVEAGGFSCGTEPYGVVSVCRLTAGRVRLSTGRDSLFLRTGDMFVIGDGTAPHVGDWAEADCTKLRLPVAALQRAAHEGGATSGGKRLRMLSRRPVSAAAAHRFAQVTSFAERHFANSDPVVQSAVGHLLAATVLTTFPNSLVPASSAVAPVRTDVPTTVAVAQDFIARNADLPIRTSDVAAHALVGVRALQLAFREHLGTSPMEYLRRYRLARVHEELAAAMPGDGTTVTPVAARWTFTESSRFAALYRGVYGELPRETLRRDP